MKEADFKIMEYFDYEEGGVWFNVLRRGPSGDYFSLRVFDTLEKAKRCVRLARQYREPIYHYVED